MMNTCLWSTALFQKQKGVQTQNRCKKRVSILFIEQRIYQLIRNRHIISSTKPFRPSKMASVLLPGCQY